MDREALLPEDADMSDAMEILANISRQTWEVPSGIAPWEHQVEARIEALEKQVRDNSTAADATLDNIDMETEVLGLLAVQVRELQEYGHEIYQKLERLDALEAQVRELLEHSHMSFADRGETRGLPTDRIGMRPKGNAGSAPLPPDYPRAPTSLNASTIKEKAEVQDEL